MSRLEAALSLDTFLFNSLTRELDLSQMDQRAKLASLARPLLQTLPPGNYKTMMYAHLSELVGVNQRQDQSTSSPAPEQAPELNPERATHAVAIQPISPHVRDSLRLLLQYPELVEVANEFELLADADSWLELLDQLIGMINVNPRINTARLLERLRYNAQHSVLENLAAREFDLEEDKRQDHLRDLMSRIDLASLQKQVTTLLNSMTQRKTTDEERKKLNELNARVYKYKQL